MPLWLFMTIAFALALCILVIALVAVVFRPRRP